MSPPVSMLVSMKSYRDAGLKWVENTQEELEKVTQEMLEQTANVKFSQQTDDELQGRFKTVAEACGLKYDGRPLKAFSPIGQDFLRGHADLLGGGF